MLEPIQQHRRRSSTIMQGITRDHSNSFYSSQQQNWKMFYDLQLDEDLCGLTYILTKHAQALEEIEALRNSLKHLQFFKRIETQLNEQDAHRLYKCLNYEFVPAGNFIFQYGQSGDKFYILLRGCASVFLQTNLGESNIKMKSYDLYNDDHRSFKELIDAKEKEKIAQQSISPTKKSDYHSPIIKILFEEKDITLEQKTTVKPELTQAEIQVNMFLATCNYLNWNLYKANLRMDQPHGLKRGKLINFPEEIRKHYTNGIISNDDISRSIPNFSFIQHIISGQGFGDIALIQNIRRTASILTREDCHMVVISKENYIKFLSKIDEHVYQEKINFIKSYDFFDQIQQKLSNLFVCFEEKNFQRGDTIYNQGEQTDFIYFVRQGEVQLTQKYSPKQIQQHLDDNELSIDDDDVSQQVQFQEETLTFVQEEDKALFIEPIKHVQVEKHVAFLGPHTYFGEQEIITKTVTRQYTARAKTATVQLFCISRRNFQYVCKHNEIWQRLQENLQNKLNWREKYFYEDSIIGYVKNQKDYTPAVPPPSHDISAGEGSKPSIINMSNQVEQIHPSNSKLNDFEDKYQDYLQQDSRLGNRSALSTRPPTQVNKDRSSCVVSKNQNHDFHQYHQKKGSSAQQLNDFPSEMLKLNNIGSSSTQKIQNDKIETHQVNISVDLMIRRGSVSRKLQANYNQNFDGESVENLKSGTPKKKASFTFQNSRKNSINIKNQNDNRDSVSRDSKDHFFQNSTLITSAPAGAGGNSNSFNQNSIKTSSANVYDSLQQGSVDNSQGFIKIKEALELNRTMPLAFASYQQEKSFQEGLTCQYIPSANQLKQRKKREKEEKQMNSIPGLFATGTYQCLLQNEFVDFQEVKPNVRPRSAQTLTNNLIVVQLSAANNMKRNETISCKGDGSGNKSANPNLINPNSNQKQNTSTINNSSFIGRGMGKSNQTTIELQGENEMREHKPEIKEKKMKLVSQLTEEDHLVTDFGLEFQRNEVTNLFKLRPQEEINIAKKQMVSRILQGRNKKVVKKVIVDQQQEDQREEIDRVKNEQMFQQNLIIGTAAHTKFKFEWSEVQNSLLKNMWNEANVAQKRRAQIYEDYQFRKFSNISIPSRSGQKSKSQNQSKVTSPTRQTESIHNQSLLINKTDVRRDNRDRAVKSQNEIFQEELLAKSSIVYDKQEQIPLFVNKNLNVLNNSNLEDIDFMNNSLYDDITFQKLQELQDNAEVHGLLEKIDNYKQFLVQNIRPKTFKSYRQKINYYSSQGNSRAASPEQLKQLWRSQVRQDINKHRQLVIKD